jgi:predicted membrane-bound spermidine synthase
MLNDVAGRHARSRVPVWVLLVFFVSGFAALLYQVVWQRALFTIFGINIESVTIVVTAFLVGLGLGSLAGGAASKNGRRRNLLYFAMIECGIGAFGFWSLKLFRWVGELTLTASSVERAAATFGLVLLPTALMGATLPVLFAYVVRITGNVGRSVGLLYFVNTAGSAAAALMTAMVILRHLGESKSVAVAAMLNIGVAVYTLFRYARSGDGE